MAGTKPRKERLGHPSLVEYLKGSKTNGGRLGLCFEKRGSERELPVAPYSSFVSRFEKKKRKNNGHL